MARKRYTTEQIIGHWKQRYAWLQGEAVGVVCRGLGITEQT